MFLQKDRSDGGYEFDDNELWTSFRNGNREALSALFLRYYDTLLHYGLKLISDNEATKDGIQQLFLELWEKRENISEATSAKFYLLYSLRRTLFRQQDVINSREERNEVYSNIQPEYCENIEQKIIDTEIEKEREKMYQEGLNKLTSRQKEILFLRLNHGMRNKEIAQITGLTHQRVRNYMSEAIKKLKEHIFEDKLFS